MLQPAAGTANLVQDLARVGGNCGLRAPRNGGAQRGSRAGTSAVASLAVGHPHWIDFGLTPVNSIHFY